VDRHDFKDAFDWAAQIEKEDKELYDVPGEDRQWLDDLARVSESPTKMLHRYAHEDVAWTEFYVLEARGMRWQATCTKCGEIFYKRTTKQVRDAVQRHILNGCHTEPRGKPDVDSECPF
jgi:NAD-dependent SIR2 family protein deacetylase